MILDYNVIEYRGVKIHQNHDNTFWVQRPDNSGAIYNATVKEAKTYIDTLLDGGSTCQEFQEE